MNKDDLEKLYAELGKAYYEGGFEDPLPQLLPLFHKITEIRNCEKLAGMRQSENRQTLMPTRICASCGSKIPINASFCVECGKPAPVQGKQKLCRNCGSPVKEGALFCGECGTPAQ